jgi:tryptophan synthase alpha chain
MMNRIRALFQTKVNNILSVYFTAGYPDKSSTTEIIKGLEQAGADMIEIGIPFSDPVADGPVIQQSNNLALKNGMNLKLLFQQLKDIRNEVTIPLVMMGYINPVLQFGIENFCRKCAETGIDGIIIPDFPPEIYFEKYNSVFEKFHVQNIFLISPQTSDHRIRMIDNVSQSFIYVVSSFSTTGAIEGFSIDQFDYFVRIKNMKLGNPSLIGFGIFDSITFNQACKFANGAIIGSAFINMLSEKGVSRENIDNFISGIRNTQIEKFND